MMAFIVGLVSLLVVYGGLLLWADLRRWCNQRQRERVRW